MFKRSPYCHSCLTLFLIISVFITGLLPLPATAQDRRRKPVIVSFGQPNIWSLEQAHYLLARMHMTNLELQAKSLSVDDLDPNATNGTRIQLLRQLFGVEAQFDQSIGFQNQRIVENARFNDSRRRDLLTRRDKLEDDSLSLTREINRLTIERERMNSDTSATPEAKALKDTELQAKKDEQAAVKEQITQQNDELKTLNAEPSSSPTSPSLSASPVPLPTSALQSLIDKNANKLLDAAKDPKLNATTMLDNTVQLQYEIIAKQLTLLRDEVGPGERLVFLELPQSIYTTPGSGDEKMAQTWWHVNGYTRTDPLVRLLLELYEVELKWKKVQEVNAYGKEGRKTDTQNWTCNEERMTDEKQVTNQVIKEKMKKDPVLELFVSLKCERENAREAVLRKLYREANSVFARVEQNGARDNSEIVEAIRRLIDSKKQKNIPVPEGGARAQINVDARKFGTEDLVSNSESQQVEQDRRDKIDRLKELLLNVLSENDPLNPADDKSTQTLNLLRQELQSQKDKFEKAMEFIRLDETTPTETSHADIQRRTVRTVDIIPRQSSLNVNDINDTVKQTGIVAAFKFLFGFAASLNYQRQREQFEQFLHQELYASGFGKGSRDFGWTFGALPGTNRVAPGIRTTFAALVVPEDAESIVLSAKGCYFPRKSYQPLDFEDTGHNDWNREDKFRSYNCGEEENYILPIPGGGNISNFWVTSIDYQDEQKSGDYATISVRGNNFSSQMGVLIDGVPLYPTVGLAQPNLMPRRQTPNGPDAGNLPSECVSTSTICGRYERVDSEQIVFTFKMPSDYIGTPTITLIAPGKSLDLNSLINVRINGVANANLRRDAAPVFGNGLTITDFQPLRDLAASSTMSAVLTGTRFKGTDTIYVNGTEIGAIANTSKTFKSPSLVILKFPACTDENLKVTVVQDKVAVSKSVPNPAVLKITTSAVAKFEPASNNKPAVLLLRIEGQGLPPSTCQSLTVEGATCNRVAYVSPNKMTVRLLNPELPVVLSISSPQGGNPVRVVLEKIPDQATGSP